MVLAAITEESRLTGAKYIVAPLVFGGIGLLMGTFGGVGKGHIYEYKIVHQSEKP